MNPRVVIPLIIVVAVAIGVTIALSGKGEPEAAATPVAQPTAEASASATTTKTVTLSASGFSPKEITISAGQSVQFVNDSGSPAVIASAPHPAHTDLRGLESSTLQNGASYLFVFESAGEFGYHNHLNPGLTGTVIVQ